MKFFKTVIASLALATLVTPLVGQTTAQAAKTHHRRVTTKNYGQLTIAQTKHFQVNHADPKAILTLDEKHSVAGHPNQTYYTYQLKLTNKTKKNVRFYFSNLKLNSFDVNSKKIIKKNVKPSYTAKHIVLKPKQTRVVKNAISFKLNKFNQPKGQNYSFFLEYGKFAQSKLAMAGVEFGTQK